MITRARRSIQSHPWFCSGVFVIVVLALVVSPLLGLPIVVTLGLLSSVAAGAILLLWLWGRDKVNYSELASRHGETDAIVAERELHVVFGTRPGTRRVVPSLVSGTPTRSSRWV